MKSMNIARLLFTVIILITIVCAVLLIQYAYKKRIMPGANSFILLMLTSIMYSVGYIGELNSNTMGTAMFWFYLEHIPMPIQHYLWMVMSLEYCKVSKKYLTIAKYLGLYHPILYILIFFTNSFHHLYISSYRFESNGYFKVIVSAKASLFILMVASGTILAVISMFFYIRGLIKSTNLHKYDYGIMIIASIFPWISIYLGAVNKNYLGIDYFPVFSAVSGIIYMFGIFKFRIFNVIPIAAEIVFRQSSEGIMLIDLADNIIDVNSTYIKIYPEMKYLHPRYSLNSFLQRHPELNGINGEDSIFEFMMKQNDHERYYSVKVTQIMTEDTLEMGRIITLTDITLYVEHQKILESAALNALNKAQNSEIAFLQAQIKPHFLNNTLSIIGSMITRDPHRARELIGNLGQYLADCCYIDSSTPFIKLEQELETINTYVDIEKARFGERLKFHVVGNEIPEIKIPRLILQPLIENAIRHGILKKASGGNVWLTITTEESGVSFEIKDDGVGIPVEKLSGLLSEEKVNNEVGIYNAHKRLIMHYGVGLSIVSTRNEGTTITFSIPYN